MKFVASLDAVLHEHLQTATVFKGTSKTAQNELLDCMLSVLRECITEEIRSANFVSIQADKTMDISTQCQLVLVIRYTDKAHDVQQRFIELISLHSATADSITTALLDRLSLGLKQFIVTQVTQLQKLLEAKILLRSLVKFRSRTLYAQGSDCSTRTVVQERCLTTSASYILNSVGPVAESKCP